jgi:hypothetical protein
MATRFAVVTGGRAQREVEAYLPGNYRVVDAADQSELRAGTTLRMTAFVIAGEDDAGWTLDGYVTPRLWTGLMGCVEYPSQEAALAAAREAAR